MGVVLGPPTVPEPASVKILAHGIERCPNRFVVASRLTESSGERIVAAHEVIHRAIGDAPPRNDI
jgi:hypothetical protein